MNKKLAEVTKRLVIVIAVLGGVLGVFFFAKYVFNYPTLGRTIAAITVILLEIAAICLFFSGLWDYTWADKEMRSSIVGQGCKSYGEELTSAAYKKWLEAITLFTHHDDVWTLAIRSGSRPPDLFGAFVNAGNRKPGALFLFLKYKS